MLEQIKYRAKALVAAGGLILVGLAEYIVTAPDTSRLLEQLLPAPANQLVPFVLATAAVVLVHAVPNAPAPGTAASPITTAQADAVRALIDQHLGARIQAASQRTAAASRPAPVQSAPTGIVKLVPPVGGGN